MPNTFSQVQQARKKFGALYVLEKLASGSWDQEETPKRRYPGETQGLYLTEHLNSLSRFPAKQSSLLKSVYICQEIAREMKSRDVPNDLRKLRKRIRFAEEYLVDAALSALRKDSKGRWALGIRKDGLIVEPTTPEARAAIAALWLTESGRIDCIKQCLYCRSWFFARFKHQQFCSDPKKKCQFNHYHSSEWRKRNRERNRKDQIEYRKRNPGRRH